MNGLFGGDFAVSFPNHGPVAKLAHLLPLRLALPATLVQNFTLNLPNMFSAQSPTTISNVTVDLRRLPSANLSKPIWQGALGGDVVIDGINVHFHCSPFILTWKR